MGYPPEHITQLVNDAQAAEAVLDKVKSGERTAADELLRYRFTRRKKEAVGLTLLNLV